MKGTGYTFHSPVSPSLHQPKSPCAITFRLESAYLTYTISSLNVYVCSQIGSYLEDRAVGELIDAVPWQRWIRYAVSKYAYIFYLVTSFKDILQLWWFSEVK